MDIYKQLINIELTASLFHGSTPFMPRAFTCPSEGLHQRCHAPSPYFPPATLRFLGATLQEAFRSIGVGPWQFSVYQQWSRLEEFVKTARPIWFSTTP
jgi:hypothetical protein